MTKLQATPTHDHMKQRPFMSSDFSHCTHVCTTGCSTSDFGTAIPRSSQGHQMWSQNIHYRCSQQTGGNNIIGSSKTSAHRRFGYNRRYSYQRNSLASSTSCTNSTSHNEDNSVTTTCPLAWSLCSMNVHVYWWRVLWRCSSTLHWLGTSVRNIETSSI